MSAWIHRLAHFLRLHRKEWTAVYYRGCRTTYVRCKTCKKVEWR